MINSKIIIGLSALLLAGACHKSVDMELEMPTLSQAPIIGDASGATKGQILVKFTDSMGDELEAIQAQSVTRSGVMVIDEQLEQLSATSLRRVFPIDSRREQITRESGMHLWYVIDFDPSLSLTSVASEWASLECVTKVEYMSSLQYSERRSAVPYTDQQVLAVEGAGVNDPLYGAQWGLTNRGDDSDYTTGYGGYIAGADISAEQAWDIYAKSQGASDEQIIVAILDEAVDYMHPDLVNRMWVNEGEALNQRTDADGNGYEDDLHGYNFVFGHGRLALDGDDTGHGTHVAGIIAAENNNGVGVASIAGGSDNIKIMSCQIFSGYSSASTLEQAMAVKYAADNGAVVLQCSWGLNSSEASMITGQGSVGNDEDYILAFGILKEAFDYFIHNASSPNGVVDGGVVVFSAGNESAPLPGYPSNYGDYVCVTAIAADYTPSIYTNYGGNSTVAAPGGDRDYYVHEEGEILSTMPTLLSESGYGYMEGTSMATPMVSGVVALGLSHAANNYKHIKAESIKDLLMQSTDEIDSYMVGNKEFYYYSAGTGDEYSPQKDLLDLTKFSGKMGTGLINASKFLQLIEGSDVGAEFKVPNYTVGVGAVVSDDLSVYFVDKSISFGAKAANSSIAEVSVDGSTLTIKGVERGSTKVTITAGGIEQVITVIVNNTSGSGWM
ncbi:MAG: S8 family serine peptidase [Rikenellaceae bacterium]